MGGGFESDIEGNAALGSSDSCRSPQDKGEFTGLVLFKWGVSTIPDIPKVHLKVP